MWSEGVVEGVVWRVVQRCEWLVWSGSGEGCSHVVRIGEGCDQVSDGGCGQRWKGVMEVWSGLWSGVSAE